ncbi:hypothetical protein MRB53_001811 [Persea americana]|uniref:Uncharacterized protein n=1 Tax=Persea americana TaxID=3435 RepID=A0ACC2MT32_PERAE|nr:hypothetical protein MRB53_001811 [Persea americana]
MVRDGWKSMRISLLSSEFKAKAKLAKLSARAFSYRPTCFIITSPIPWIRRCASTTHATIRSSRAAYSPFNWLATNCDHNRATYFASLFDAAKPIVTALLIKTPFGVMNTMPTPEPRKLDPPSTYSYRSSVSRPFSSFLLCFTSSLCVNFV